jgi:hypothetical protein
MLPDLNQIWIFPRQIFVQVSNIKFCENPSSESRADTCGKTRRFSTLRERAKKIQIIQKMTPIRSLQ